MRPRLGQRYSMESLRGKGKGNLLLFNLFWKNSKKFLKKFLNERSTVHLCLTFYRSKTVRLI